MSDPSLVDASKKFLKDNWHSDSSVSETDINFALASVVTRDTTGRSLTKNISALDAQINADIDIISTFYKLDTFDYFAKMGGLIRRNNANGHSHFAFMSAKTSNSGMRHVRYSQRVDFKHFGGDTISDEIFLFPFSEKDAPTVWEANFIWFYAKNDSIGLNRRYILDNHRVYRYLYSKYSSNVEIARISLTEAVENELLIDVLDILETSMRHFDGSIEFIQPSNKAFVADFVLRPLSCSGKTTAFVVPAAGRIEIYDSAKDIVSQICSMSPVNNEATLYSSAKKNLERNRKKISSIEKDEVSKIEFHEFSFIAQNGSKQTGFCLQIDSRATLNRYLEYAGLRVTVPSKSATSGAALGVEVSNDTPYALMSNSSDMEPSLAIARAHQAVRNAMVADATALPNDIQESEMQDVFVRLAHKKLTVAKCKEHLEFVNMVVGDFNHNLNVETLDTSEALALYSYEEAKRVFFSEYKEGIALREVFADAYSKAVSSGGELPRIEVAYSYSGYTFTPIGLGIKPSILISHKIEAERKKWNFLYEKVYASGRLIAESGLTEIYEGTEVITVLERYLKNSLSYTNTNGTLQASIAYDRNSVNYHVIATPDELDFEEGFVCSKS
jgi:hypothetical protein